MFFGWGSHPYSYNSTAWVEPVAMFGEPDYQAPLGPVQGRNLVHIGQDIADALVHCQNGEGYWHYNCQQGGIDGSTNGWPPEALRLLNRKFGIETYAWARNLQRNRLNGHSGTSGCYYHGWRTTLSGNCLTGYGWTEDQSRETGAAGKINQLLQAAQGVNYNAAGAATDS